MTPEQMEKRKTIMRRSIALGHCVCDPKLPCPCPMFKEKDVCQCAGESLPVMVAEVKLTETVRGAGCASKIGKMTLKKVLAGLPEIDDPRVVVGSSAGDDAGVVMLSEDEATILTVDVFAPSVDDPYTFGQIAAANSVSDVYAMGGIPQAALSIIGFPIHTLPVESMHEILRGGVEKMKEAGVPVVGGHSINDSEVKCGFAVTGTAPAKGFITNSGAQVGDAIVLTKPLGNGIVAFAHQVKRVDCIKEIAESMAALNKEAGLTMKAAGAHAATDITGYSLLGHMSEIVKNSGVEVEIDFDAIPFFSKVRELACSEVLPGAVERNRESVSPGLLDVTRITPAQVSALFGPETSGGLLIFMPQDRAETFVAHLKNAGVTDAAIIGSVTGTGAKIRIVSEQSAQWETIPLQKLVARKVGSDCCAAPAEDSACCAAPAPAETSCCPSEGEADAGSCCGNIEPLRSGMLVDQPPEVAAGFKTYMQAVNAPGGLDTRQKKLISLALSVVTKCEPCVKINTNAAREAGATDREIAEAVALGVSFGGASVNMFYNQLLSRS